MAPTVAKKNSPKNKKTESSSAVKVFQKEWLDSSKHPEFKGWLQEIKNNPTKCRCDACDKILNAGKSDLLKHATGKKHLENKVGTKAIRKIDEVITNRNIKSIKHQTKIAKMRLGAFFCKSNAELSLIDTLVLALKTSFPDSEICKNMKLCRCKCTAIICKFSSPVAVHSVAQEIGQNFFSILIDETTDVANVKQMCLLV